MITATACEYHQSRKTLIRACPSSPLIAERFKQPKVDERGKGMFFMTGSLVCTRSVGVISRCSQSVGHGSTTSFKHVESTGAALCAVTFRSRQPDHSRVIQRSLDGAAGGSNESSR